MQIINKLSIISALIALFYGCAKYEEFDTITPNDSSLVCITTNYNNDFISQSLTKSVMNIATSRESEMKNATMFVFTNENPISATQPDANGTFLMYAETNYDSAAKAYKTYIKPYNKPVTVFAVANLPQSVLDRIKSIYDNGEIITYREFIQMTILPIAHKTIEDGRVVANEDNVILENKSDGSGILPISVDPIQLSALTQEVVDMADAQNEKASWSKFGYSRIDVVIDMPEDEKKNVKLIEAYLSNVPIVPNYTGVVDDVEYLDYTLPVTPATNVYTPEQPDAVGSDDIIQGLYMYPNTVVEGVTATNQVYIIVKANTLESDGDEYYKVLIEYDKNGDGIMEHSIERNTRYRLLIKAFSGNGYLTLNEALDNPPSNVQFDITIDSDSGNEFLVTNGTSYMALSNTVVDLYGEKSKVIGKSFVGFSVYFEQNSEIYAPETPLNVTRKITTTSPGLIVLNGADFATNFKEKEKYEVKLMIDDNFTGTGELMVRVGSLVQKIVVNHAELASTARAIDNYENSQYTYAYLDYGEEVTTDIATWIRFGDTSDLEYVAKPNEGVPITLTALAMGYRDNFDCPAFIYNLDGESVRVYIYQESVEEIDYSDPGTVNSYIGGTYASRETLTLSNTYILNPSKVNARKYYIPISSRIKEVWSNRAYATSAELAPYDDGTGNFKLPVDWNVEVVWYDSQRVYDGHLEFRRDLPNPNTGEERMSVIIPANMENFGNVLVSVVDGAGNILWCWTFWITNYNPTSIARVSNPDNGAGSYTSYYDETQDKSVGIFTAAGSRVYEDAIHRYNGSTWSNNTLNGKRFIMDRNFGAFANSSVGHGTVLSIDKTSVIAPPSSGACFAQHGNPRPFTGVGALKGDGTPFEFVESSVEIERSIIYILQHPYEFFHGGPSFGTWIDDATNPGVNDTDHIWYDVSLSTGRVGDKVKKSIFDPSPLGWMLPTRYTFDDFSYDTVKDDFTVPARSNTAKIYNGFAYFYFTSYRSSDGGVLKDAKQDSNLNDIWIRSNEAADGKDGYSLAMDSDDNTFGTNVVSGKAAGLSFRCVTQAEY